tara:strand:+ start:24453 stop:25043 length:591 start_codon:yes stop_codon:yes gene_type:complete
MKTYELKDIPTYLINLPEATDRLAKSTECLNKINQPFQVAKGVQHEQGIVGCGIAHYNALMAATAPCLILEDDIALTDHTLSSFSVSEDVDALYLGVSNHGYVRKRNVGIMDAVMASRWDWNYKRVFNMCAAHAVVYLSDRYLKRAREITAWCLQNNVAWDLGISAIHKDFNIITPNDPMFFQSEQPHNTKFSLEV